MSYWTCNMGLLLSRLGLCQSAAEQERAAHSKALDRSLRKMDEEQRKLTKLLLLGAGETGKTTVLKQLKMKHKYEPIAGDAAEIQTRIVFCNVIVAMTAILNAVEVAHSKQEEKKLVLKWNGNKGEPFTRELTEALLSLWAEPDVQHAARNRTSELHLPESAAHFLDSIERIADPSFTPTTDDILLSRIQTTGVTEVTFHIENVSLKVIDAGGQREERHKWARTFEGGVDAILFIASLSEYDQELREAKGKNRMRESLELFGSINSSGFFLTIPIILFLNKKDLFERKLATVPFEEFFPEYEGLNEYRPVVAFITEMYQRQHKLVHEPKVKLHVHETCATDPEQVQQILSTVTNLIIERNLAMSGMS